MTLDLEHGPLPYTPPWLLYSGTELPPTIQHLQTEVDLNFRFFSRDLIKHEGLSPLPAQHECRPRVIH